MDCFAVWRWVFIGFLLWITKIKTSHPTIGTKGIPSAVPPAFVKRRSLKVQTHSQPVTELPGAPYLFFRRQLMGESPALHIRRFHHPALSKMQNQYKAAQSSLLSYPQHISIFILIMQVEFIRLTELFPCDMLKIRKER